MVLSVPAAFVLAGTNSDVTAVAGNARERDQLQRTADAAIHDQRSAAAYGRSSDVERSGAGGCQRRLDDGAPFAGGSRGSRPVGRLGGHPVPRHHSRAGAAEWRQLDAWLAELAGARADRR